MTNNKVFKDVLHKRAKRNLTKNLSRVYLEDTQQKIHLFTKSISNLPEVLEKQKTSSKIESAQNVEIENLDKNIKDLEQFIKKKTYLRSMTQMRTKTLTNLEEFDDEEVVD